MNDQNRWSRIAARTYRIMAWLLALGVVAQTFLAGMSLFVDGNRWRLHANVGHAFSLPLLAMLLIAVIGRLPRRLAGLALLAFALLMVQGATAAIGGWAGVAHPANALMIFWLSIQMISKAGALR